MPETAANETLADLRVDIDRIDASMHELLMERGRIIDRLSEFGYEGVISVEHEDPICTGTPDRVEKGLRIARRTLAPLLAD